MKKAICAEKNYIFRKNKARTMPAAARCRDIACGGSPLLMSLNLLNSVGTVKEIKETVQHLGISGAVEVQTVTACIIPAESHSILVAQNIVSVEEKYLT